MLTTKILSALLAILQGPNFMIEPNSNFLQQYLDADAKLMPLRTWQSLSRDGAKTGKLPIEKGWQNKDYDSSEMMSHMQAGGNVGFKVGRGWGVIDYDPRNDLDYNGNIKPRQSWIIWKLLSDFKLRPNDFTSVETGGGGLHIYLRIPDGYIGRERLPDTYGKGVEFKTSPRRYVVAAGSVHPGATGEPLNPNYYLWGEGSIPLESTCDAPEKLLEAFRHRAPALHVQGEGDETFGRFSGDQLAKALKHIPPADFNSAGKDDWFEFMCACHWFTGGTGGDEFIDWSTSDPQYAGHDDSIRERWDSLGEKAGSIRSGLIFKKLKEHNVPDDQWPREKTSAVFEAPDPEELKLDQMPLSKEAQIIRQMNTDHAFVMVGSEGFISRHAYNSARPDPFVTFSSVKNMQHEYANKRFTTILTTPTGQKQAEMTWFDYWFRSPERREFKGVDFKPEEGPEYMTPAGLYMNLWQGWPFRIEDGRGAGDWSKLRELILKVVAQDDPKIYDYTMKWMAYSVQRARGPQGVAFVMRGPKGIGKSILAEAWCRLFGNHSLITDDDNDVFGQFNERMATTCALFLDEAGWAGDRAKLGKVKARITQDQVRVEQKFQPARSVSNNVKIMMATNNEWAVPASENERRFVVFDCVQVWKKRDPFFGEVKDELFGVTRSQTHGLRAMFYDLMNMDLTGWHPEANQVKTKGLGDQVLQTFGDVGEWWYEILDGGEAPMMFDTHKEFRDKIAMHDWETRPIAVPMSALRDSLKSYLGPGYKGELLYGFKQKYANHIMRLMPEHAKKKIRMQAR